MINFVPLKIESHINDNKGSFVVTNLERGFGHTLGVAIRRTLLSSIVGVACFAVRIDGIAHENEVIKGVKENALSLILNIKNLIIKIDESVYPSDQLEKEKIESWPTLKINAKSSGVITANDIECPAGFSIINKNLYICTIEDNSTSLKIEIYANRGRGFVSYIENGEKISSNGIIPIDSDYSPVLHVNWNVNEEKVSKNGVTNTLILTIATNGSLTPIEALSSASNILTQHLNSFIDLAKNPTKNIFETPTSESSPSSSQKISTNISDFNLTVRSSNALKRNGIQTLQELSQMSWSALESINALGKKSLSEIKRLLKNKGITLK